MLITFTKYWLSMFLKIFKVIHNVDNSMWKIFFAKTTKNVWDNTWEGYTLLRAVQLTI